MRGVAAYLIGLTVGMIGLVLSIGFGISAGVSGGVQQGFVTFALMAAATIFVTWKIINGTLEGGRQDMTEWLNSKADCKYRSAYDGDGIAMNIDKRLVYLTSRVAGRPVEKAYPFDDIREWGYDMPGTNKIAIFGQPSAMAQHQVAIMNAGAMTQTADRIGFWVKVKDIDRPRWFLRFQAINVKESEVRHKLDRWMEIFEQHVNSN